MKHLPVIIFAFIILVGIFIFLNKNNSSLPQSNNTTNNSQKVTDKSASGQVSTVFADNLDTPWSITFLPDKNILATQRDGAVFHITQNGTKEKIGVVDGVKEYGEGGLMGMTLDPDFSKNNLVYFYYTYNGDGNNTLNRVVKMEYKNNRFENQQIVVDKIPGAIFHDGGRIKFGPDRFLYVTTGDATQPSLSQNKNSLAGKILRVATDGKPASGNPFGNLVYSLGHRNPQGITWDDNGKLWETEHGPSGTWPNCCQDEVNIIEIGKNYGWPDSLGDKVRSGTIAPLKHSGRDIWAPGGVAYYEGSLYFGGLRGTALYEYKIATKEIVAHFKNQFGRIRDVVLGPDNFLYITTSNLDGRGFPKQADDKIIKVNLELL